MKQTKPKPKCPNKPTMKQLVSTTKKLCCVKRNGKVGLAVF